MVVSSHVDYDETARQVDWAKDDSGIRPRGNSGEDPQHVKPRGGIERWSLRPQERVGLEASNGEGVRLGGCLGVD